MRRGVVGRGFASSRRGASRPERAIRRGGGVQVVRNEGLGGQTVMRSVPRARTVPVAINTEMHTLFEYMQGELGSLRNDVLALQKVMSKEIERQVGIAVGSMRAPRMQRTTEVAGGRIEKIVVPRLNL